jgi:hypothetical protein
MEVFKNEKFHVEILDVLWVFSISSSGNMDVPVIIGDSSILQRIGGQVYRITPCNNRGICDGDKCDCAYNWFGNFLEISYGY